MILTQRIKNKGDESNPSVQEAMQGMCDFTMRLTFCQAQRLPAIICARLDKMVTFAKSAVNKKLCAFCPLTG